MVNTPHNKSTFKVMNKCILFTQITMLYHYQMVDICSCFALSIHVRCLDAGQWASQHHIEQRRQVHSSLAGAVRSENDALAADRCGSVLSARMIIIVCSTMSLMLEEWKRSSEGSPIKTSQCVWKEELLYVISSCLLAIGEHFDIS